MPLQNKTELLSQSPVTSEQRGREFTQRHSPLGPMQCLQQKIDPSSPPMAFTGVRGLILTSMHLWRGLRLHSFWMFQIPCLGANLLFWTLSKIAYLSHSWVSKEKGAQSTLALVRIKRKTGMSPLGLMVSRWNRHSYSKLRNGNRIPIA